MGRQPRRPLRLCLVGAGTRFLSGPSYYTRDLAGALADVFDVRLITMRQLLPTRLYPGSRRVGAALTRDSYDPRLQVYDGVDWYWLPTMARAIRFMAQGRPDVVVLQWWTGAVLHSHLLLALAARAFGARVVIEVHEVLDPGEARIRWVNQYVTGVAPLLMRLTDGFVVHSTSDVETLRGRFRIGRRPITVIPMGPFEGAIAKRGAAAWREAPRDTFNILSFGLIRPYKGVEQLVRAFNELRPDEIEKYWLTVAGETWEDWNAPEEAIAASPYRDRITFINRYLSDDEVSTIFAGADGEALPYTRSLGSGALQLTLSYGLPVVVSDVPALREAVQDYPGARLVPVGDVAGLTDGLRWMRSQQGHRFNDPHSWSETAEHYRALTERLIDGAGAPRMASFASPGTESGL